eukprot:TRINITY_DN2456_c1_g1_i1.p1 TRINITY_DN2456_c1_g1~~TRINITY_DN2456_c1_g1_i1.p1  ORF type:complete len:685 (-),score=192.54 TRINITY_DN2456_c1_g1_i1:63-2117(-)
MLHWLQGKSNASVEAVSGVTESLQRLYREKLLPIERDHLFHQFYSPELTDADFASRPMVLLMGQYSTGKTTFIRHLLQRDYPGLRVGPEPTTDKFVCVLHGDQDAVVPGNALVVDKTLPFTQLSHFGNAFLARLECSRLNTPVLEGISLIDSPGVLSGEKQRIKRGYEFEAVVKWFSDRVDIILLLFDVSKLDISDEFRRVILATRGNDHKIHIVLNKADGVTTQQLLRVYGALMWSLGKVIDTPEVSRVFVGSYWDEPLKNENLRDLFEQEENDLYTKLAQLPQTATVRKVNDLIKRARLAKVHAMLMEHLYNSMPYLIGHAKEQQRLIESLVAVYHEISVQRGLPLGDFPEVRMMQARLAPMDFTTFNRIDPAKMMALEELLSEDLPKLLPLIPEEQGRMGISAAAVSQVVGAASPFAVMKTGGASEQSVYQAEWLRPPNTSKYAAEFEALGPIDGKLTGAQAREKMVESRLPSNVLHRIWALADVDRDGMLTLGEYALVMHLMAMKLDGQDLPVSLPLEMIPPELEDPHYFHPPARSTPSAPSGATAAAAAGAASAAASATAAVSVAAAALPAEGAEGAAEGADDGAAVDAGQTSAAALGVAEGSTNAGASASADGAGSAGDAAAAASADGASADGAVADENAEASAEASGPMADESDDVPLPSEGTAGVFEPAPPVTEGT